MTEDEALFHVERTTAQAFTAEELTKRRKRKEKARQSSTDVCGRKITIFLLFIPCFKFRVGKPNYELIIPQCFVECVAAKLLIATKYTSPIIIFQMYNLIRL